MMRTNRIESNRINSNQTTRNATQRNATKQIAAAGTVGTVRERFVLLFRFRSSGRGWIERWKEQTAERTNHRIESNPRIGLSTLAIRMRVRCDDVRPST
mmetsp:Transcript_23493/g.48108  ORF Transcript_23493/g.48108 Transcript_23493/m.48108 type:complete len:99 (+) Transcript_23493:2-298(+)